MRDKIFVIDDEPNLRKILDATLTREGFDVRVFESFAEAKIPLNTEDVDVLITDLQMPVDSGMDVLSYCKQYAPDLPVVLITAFGTVERAVAAMQAGAFDFVLKPFQNEELFRILKKAIQSRIRRKREPAQDLMNALGVGSVPVPLFGKSKDASAFRATVERVSKTSGSVLMLGEVGTGKRSVAQQIHRNSERARGPFMQLNLEAIPPLFQGTELFGVEKGSSPLHLFSKPGIFELARGGTVFLEEIDALSVEAQNLFFSALENESFTRVGGVKHFPFDFRLVVTSSRNLDPWVKEGKFHVELFYRLSVETLVFRPLRERIEDLRSDFIPYFIERSCSKRGIPLVRCSPEAIEWLVGRDWSGNLGELEREIARAINRVEQGTLEVAHFL